MSEDTIEKAISATLSRRTFGRRAGTWVLGAGALIAGVACGDAVSKKDFQALKSDVDKVKSQQKAATAATKGATAGGHAADGAAHWAYEGTEGPAAWGKISAENAVCEMGSTQSPIDITSTQAVAQGRTVFKWKPATLSVINNGHTIQANVDEGAGGGIEIDGVPYTLVQFHFHAPSEHMINGKRAALETHFVHKSAQGELAVVGVLHAAGGENSALSPVWASLPKTTSDKAQVKTFDFATVLPKDRALFRYAGSLTTPPCSEGVRWHVLQASTTVSNDQVAAFGKIIPANSRPVQPVKARDVLREPGI